MSTIPINYFKNIINIIKRYDKKSKINKKIQFHKINNFRQFCLFREIFEIEIDNFDLKYQLCIMILFYLFYSNKYSKNVYLYFHDIQTLFYIIEEKDELFFAKLKNKNILFDKINKIVGKLSQNKRKDSCSGFSGRDEYLKDLYDYSINEFYSFLDENKISEDDFCSLKYCDALLIIILFYEKLLLSLHTWYVIDVDNINIAEYFDKKDYNIFECKESFFKINNLQFFDRILSASEIELKISENNNLSEIQKCIRIIIKKIYQYNDKFNVYRPNEHYFPKSEYFSSFFKNMNKFKYFDEKNQLYMIILFYLSLADYLNIPLYKYISYIQKILFYKKILRKNKCYAILQEKKILYSIIKDIIELIKIKEKNDIKNSKYICDSIIIKDFDIFFGNE